MAGRQFIIRCREGKWSASYSDRPEERFYGVTMQEAIDRLVNSNGARRGGPGKSASESAEFHTPEDVSG